MTKQTEPGYPGETGAYFVETSFVAPTDTQGIKTRVRMAGSKKQIAKVGFYHYYDGGIDQHRYAVSTVCSGTIKVAYATKAGYVFAVYPGEK